VDGCKAVRGGGGHHGWHACDTKTAAETHLSALAGKPVLAIEFSATPVGRCWLNPGPPLVDDPAWFQRLKL